MSYQSSYGNGNNNGGGNSNQNGGPTKSTVYETYLTLFGANGKALTFGMGNDKFRIGFVSYSDTQGGNGGGSWNFKDPVVCSLDLSDLDRLYIACRHLITIYLQNQRDPTAKQRNQILNTDVIDIPFMAFTTGQVYATLSIGITTNRDGNEAFSLYYHYTPKEERNTPGADTVEQFVFRTRVSADGILAYKNSKTNEQYSTSTMRHLDFATFVTLIEQALKEGKLMYGMHKGIRFGGGGNYNRVDNSYGGYKSNYGSRSSDGGNDTGGSAGGNDFPEDIPF